MYTVTFSVPSDNRLRHAAGHARAMDKSDTINFADDTETRGTLQDMTTNLETEK